MAKKKKRSLKKAKDGNKPAKATDSKNKAGRPTKMTDETVKKLEFAFMQGLSDQEACLYAGISKQTLYNYQKENTEFLDQKAAFKSNVKMHAKLNLAEEVIENKNIELSLFVLERLVDEYKPKQEVSANIDMATRYAAMSDEDLAKIAGKYDV